MSGQRSAVSGHAGDFIKYQDGGSQQTRPTKNIPVHSWSCLLCRFLAACALLRAAAAASGALSAPTNDLAPGLIVTFSSSGGQKVPPDLAVLPHAAIYVPAGKSATPFLDPAPFRAAWSGFVTTELRGEYAFQAELSGTLKLEINGVIALDAKGSNDATAAGKPIRLNKGTNLLTAEFTSPAAGDAYLRLLWVPNGGFAAPIPPTALWHNPTLASLQDSANLRLGRRLFIEHRCFQCHAAPPGRNIPAEFTMDAPSFEGIGLRRKYRWMADWILDPKAQRATATMPQLFRGDHAQQDAEAAAAFLASLQQPAGREPSLLQSALIDKGKDLFDDLHCAACHIAPGSADADPARLSLKHVLRKFPPGSLAEFLTKPEAHYAWIRMPNFKLSADEALELSAYLAQGADPPNDAHTPADPKTIERGKHLIQTSGCLNCHRLPLANQFAAAPFEKFTNESWQRGCLAESSSSDSTAAQFGFARDERQTLQRFGTSNSRSPVQECLSEFAQTQIQRLNCLACHGQFDGFPPHDILGEKLRPEWSKALLAGQIPYKPRPWLPARMPAFPKYAESLATGLSALHGYPPDTSPESPVDPALAKIGQKLVSSDGGLSCISCHAVGQTPATQVFENAGINLAYAHDRLRPSYFRRWIRNPMAIDPNSKMPVFFDEELRSVLVDICGGDGRQQIDAIWQYLSLGAKMPPPGAPRE
jgi:cytochrome c peroxidase